MPNFFTRNKTLKDSGIYWVVEELKITPEPQRVMRVLSGKGNEILNLTVICRGARKRMTVANMQSPVNCKRGKPFVMVSSTRLTLNVFKTTPPEEFFRCSLPSLVYQKSWLTWSKTIKQLLILRLLVFFKRVKGFF